MGKLIGGLLAGAALLGTQAAGAQGYLGDASRAIAAAARIAASGNAVHVADRHASVVTLNSDALGTATLVSDDILAGDDPRQVRSVPLATAIRHARNAHLRLSRPVPAGIRAALRGIIPDHVLDRARYAEGILEISVADAATRINRPMGDDFAVTVDDVIVFNRAPSHDPEDAASLRCWAHGLAHVWQYHRLGGVDRFARAYIDDYRSIEKDADVVANAAVELYGSL